jgi:hypothetical protein
VSYPLAGRDELLAAIPSLQAKYPTYKSFGASRIEDIFPREDIANAQVREAYTFASAVARNNGDGTFTTEQLPVEAQLAPIYAALADDFDGDGRLDLLLGGNFSGVQPVLGRYDASYGLMLKGDAAGHLTPVDMTSSNLLIDGEVRHMAALRGATGDRLIVVARNNDRLEILRVQPPTGRMASIHP